MSPRDLLAWLLDAIEATRPEQVEEPHALFRSRLGGSSVAYPNHETTIRTMSAGLVALSTKLRSLMMASRTRERLHATVVGPKSSSVVDRPVRLSPDSRARRASSASLRSRNARSTFTMI